MELCSFWVVNPADGQEGKPEPVKLVFFENGDMQVISLAEEPDYRGAFKLPIGSYNYSGGTLSVAEENLAKVIPLVRDAGDEMEYRKGLLAQQLINDREWEMFYANPAAWKSLRIVVITFGENN